MKCCDSKINEYYSLTLMFISFFLMSFCIMYNTINYFVERWYMHELASSSIEWSYKVARPWFVYTFNTRWRCWLTVHSQWKQYHSTSVEHWCGKTDPDTLEFDLCFYWATDNSLIIYWLVYRCHVAAETVQAVWGCNSRLVHSCERHKEFVECIQNDMKFTLR